NRFSAPSATRARKTSCPRSPASSKMANRSCRRSMTGSSCLPKDTQRGTFACGRSTRELSSVAIKSCQRSRRTSVSCITSLTPILSGHTWRRSTVCVSYRPTHSCCRHTACRFKVCTNASTISAQSMQLDSESSATCVPRLAVHARCGPICIVDSSLARISYWRWARQLHIWNIWYARASWNDYDRTRPSATADDRVLKARRWPGGAGGSDVVLHPSSDEPTQTGWRQGRGNREGGIKNERLPVRIPGPSRKQQLLADKR